MKLVVFVLKVLERMSFAKSSIKETMLQEARILLFWYCMSYALLQRNKPKFQKFESLSSKEGSSVKIEEIEEENKELITSK